MKQPTSGLAGHELRQSAERSLSERKRCGPPDAGDDPRRLLHELEVHQIELEMQNEELRMARQEVEAGLRRYAELFDFAPVAYFVIGRDGMIRETNLAGARLLGAERQRLVGRPLARFVAERSQVAWNACLGQVLAGTAEEPGSKICDLALRRDDASLLDVRLTAVALAGTSPTILIALEDVTARRRDETELRDGSRHKDEFMAALSHELRNPLAPIRNSLFVLERADPGSEQARNAKAIIGRQVTHLAHIIDDLLDVTRVARGKVRLQREHVELGDIVRRTIDDQRESFAAQGLRLEARLDAEAFWIDADGTRIVQVLGNLLGNAIKFTPRGGKVAVALRREGPWAALAVSDTGVGVAPEIRDHLFQPFRQAPQTMDRTGGGLGLGLAMVKGLVELHGGSVALASEGVGRGAEFTVRLPLVAGEPSRMPPAETAPCPRRRVLVIEDNRDSADSLVEALAIEGHTVGVAYDGASGLTVAHDFRPEVVICDIGLPGMDGYAVARALRADGLLHDSFLIALSGYAQPEDLQRSAEAGFDRHVAKPPHLPRLEQLLEQAPTLAR